VSIPQPVLEYTTPRLLVTQYLPGIKVTFRRKLESIGIDPEIVVTQLIGSYLKQILEYGFFHADPHPGNLFVVAAPENPTGFRIGFVDFGLVQETPVRFRQQLGQLVQAVLARNRQMTTEALI